MIDNKENILQEDNYIKKNELIKQRDMLLKENVSLIEQLYIVQEKLERYYKALNTFQQIQYNKNNIQPLNTCISNKNNKLFNELYMAMSQNSIHNRVSCILINAYNNGSIFFIPFKILFSYKILASKSIPNQLGKKNFDYVISSYEEGSHTKVEALLDSVKISYYIRANAYTAIAKHIQKKDKLNCAYYAKLAYITDPRPYRLKWLAFRLEDANDLSGAIVAAQLLPNDTLMNDKEKIRINYLLSLM